MTGVRCELLQPPVAPAFLSMVFPAHRHLLDLRPAPLHLNEPAAPTVQPCAVGAFAGSEPAGLALAAARRDDDTSAELLSLFVVAGRRRQGVGRDLLRAAERETAARGVARLQAVWMTGGAGSAAVEGLLGRHGWPPPTPRMLTVRFSLEDLERVPWLDRHRLRPGLEIFPWAELTVADRDHLVATQRRNPWIPRDLQPWDYDRQGFERVTSLGMRLGGEVVGWIINHPISASTLRITCSYIRDDLGRRGRIVPLWAESFRRLRTTTFRRCSFTTPLYHRGMIAFVTRWCGPWVSFLGETRGSTKLLAGPAAAALPGGPGVAGPAWIPGRERVDGGDPRPTVPHPSAER